MSRVKALEKRFYEIFHHQIILYAKRNEIKVDRKWMKKDGEGFNHFKADFFDAWVAMVDAQPNDDISVNVIDPHKSFTATNMEVGVKVRNKVMRQCDPFLAQLNGKGRKRQFSSMKEAEEILELPKNSVSRSINSGYPVLGWAFTWKDPAKEAEQISIREAKRQRIVEKERARYYANKEKSEKAKEPVKKVTKAMSKKNAPKRIKAKVITKKVTKSTKVKK